MKRAKIGIIGMGIEGKLYAGYLDKGLVDNAELAAVYNRSLPGRDWSVQNLSPSVKIYDNAEKMMKDSVLDAVIITLPHYLHPEYAEMAMKCGLHVLLEKPAGVYTGQVRRMNRIADDCNKVFAIMYNMRTNPLYKKLKEIMDSGVLGEMKRVVWIATDWYRTQAYYDSGCWRATWKDEGGGVLVNQSPHNIDILQWVCGMPCSVRAFCKYGNHRDIEVENDVTAYLEFPDGATGLFVTSTHEFPGTNRLEISGDNGKLVVEEGKIAFYKSRVPEPEFNRNAVDDSETPEYNLEEIVPEADTVSGYVQMINNFVSAILYGTALIADGREGIKEVEIANAMLLSDWIGEAVDPERIDDELFKKLLDRRINGSKA